MYRPIPIGEGRNEAIAQSGSSPRLEVTERGGDACLSFAERQPRGA
jgi:hypothetical protein